MSLVWRTLLIATNLGNGGRTVLGAETAEDGRSKRKDLFLEDRGGWRED